MNIWFTSDWHFGENRFNILQRPFTDPEEHCEILVKNYNSLVKEEDLVYVLGDVFYEKSDVNHYEKYLRKLNGRKTLIKGNHDRKIKNEVFSKYFNKIVEDGEGIDVEILGEKFYLTHYPSTGKLDIFNLVGHVHAAWKVQTNCLNVGVDVNFLYPMPLTTISFYKNAVMNFYDSDTFAAYLPVNNNFKSRAAKPGYANNLETHK